ncbi:MAG: protein-(glutamine-N5) methyltransferase, release factor-specific [Candidatus Firestonebacteria bacterium RIFOXYC2_FULL_39_67]|nr:MAG: protein-(glutamine-N5) methyltransferase, release factor-specific [Candidatus Firestonebacteria bacterium RIFOXYD2_FULL_39_29]OGF56938.1 MAG: protein-(glutamine-N5) methyltransferase, release factor-specific [Candidatus Firestonebacteria bacterium RIFOXYC2_FULL_39_67]
MIISSLMINACGTLRGSNIADAAKDVELFLCEILKCKKMDLYMNSRNTIPAEQIDIFNSYISRRLKREPVAYILGKKGFLDYELIVDKNVLIPRPETELLVETCFDMIRKDVKGYEILDLCTGSGAIAVGVARKYPFVKMTASDISKKALKVAKINAQKHKVEDKIRFLHSDLFRGLDKEKKFHLIISNPPYVAREEMKSLMDDVRLFEPKEALDGGKEGLKFYREIIKRAPYYLHPNGFLALEVGYNQAGLLKTMFIDSGKFDIMKTVRDYAMIDRIIVVKVKNG